MAEQSVKICNVMLIKKVLKCCVPQGSVLGPQLYCDYTTPLGTIFRNFLISFHMYADDSQMYKSVSPNIEEDQLIAISQLQNCISEISDWMNRNKLKLNEDKTEFLIAGTFHHHAKVMIKSLSVSGAIIPASPCVKNLGVIIDS